MDQQGNTDGAKDMQPHEIHELNDVINEILNVLFNEAAKKTGDRGVKVSFAEKIKVDMAQRIMKMAEKYNGPVKFAKLVDSSNAAIPALTRIFGEQAMTRHIPPRAKDERILALLDKAGASELVGLVRKSMDGSTPKVA